MKKANEILSNLKTLTICKSPFKCRR